jgi:hypothetical protein
MGVAGIEPQRLGQQSARGTVAVHPQQCLGLLGKGCAALRIGRSERLRASRGVAGTRGVAGPIARETGRCQRQAGRMIERPSPSSGTVSTAIASSNASSWLSNLASRRRNGADAGFRATARRTISHSWRALSAFAGSGRICIR